MGLYMIDLYAPRSNETEVAHSQDKKQDEWRGICNHEEKGFARLGAEMI